METDIRNVKVERYYPDVLSNAKEFNVIAATTDSELTNGWKALWKQMLNTFVYDFDTDGASRWEGMLKLYPKPTDSLEIRRRAILVRINSTLPYTFRSFQTMLDNIYGIGNITESVVYNKYELWLDLVAAIISKNIAVRRLAHVISPANLEIAVSNTKNCSINMYYGCAITQCRHTVIEASTECNLNVLIQVQPYSAGIIKICKHIIIGGQ